MKYGDLSDEKLDKATRNAQDSVESAQKALKMFKDAKDSSGITLYEKVLQQEKNKLDELVKEHARRTGAP